MTSAWIPGDSGSSDLVSVGDAVPALATPTGFVHTRPSGYTLHPSLQVAFDNDALPAFFVQAFQHDDVKIIFDGYDANSGGLGTFCSSPNGTFSIAKNGGTLYISAGSPGAGNRINFHTCLSTDLNGNVTIPNSLTATTATLGMASIASSPTIPQALYIWVELLPTTTLTGDGREVAQPITPYNDVLQLNGQFPDNAYFDSYGRFAPPVKGIWHFGARLSVSTPSSAISIGMGFQMNYTDGATNLLSATETSLAGSVARTQGMQLTGTALVGPTDYINMFAYVGGTGAPATTNDNTRPTNFFAALIHRTA